jgi:hypothetical protein
MRDYQIKHPDTGKIYFISDAPTALIRRALELKIVVHEHVTVDAATERLKLELEIRAMEGRL